jgi:hypothetical protein
LPATGSPTPCTTGSSDAPSARCSASDRPEAEGGTPPPTQTTRRHHPWRLGPQPPTPTRSIAPLVRAGKATCARCGEPIHPEDDDWHLDHNADRNGYLGPSHARCNLAAGAAVVNGRRSAQAQPDQPEKPYRWSQRWYDDPPIGTINYDGGRNPEVYADNGKWTPLEGSRPGSSAFN